MPWAHIKQLQTTQGQIIEVLKTVKDTLVDHDNKVAIIANWSDKVREVVLNHTDAITLLEERIKWLEKELEAMKKS